MRFLPVVKRETGWIGRGRGCGLAMSYVMICALDVIEVVGCSLPLPVVMYDEYL